MVYIYAVDVRHLEDPKRCPDLLLSLNEEVKKEILSHNTSYGRIESLAINLFSKEVYSRHQISAVPDAVNNLKSDSYHLSFSSSKNIMICALGNTPLGCSIRKIENAPKVFPSHFFSFQERKYLNGFDGEALNQEFYRLYTIKESYMNMADEDFSHLSKVLEVVIDEEVELQRDGCPENCWIEEYAIPGYKISVCTKENEFASDIKFITIL